MNKEKKHRTEAQNNALHPTLREYAEKLNDAGYDYRQFIEEALKKGVLLPWTEHNIKETFDLVTQGMYGKTSSQLTTVEMQDCWKVFHEHMAKLSGISQEWHSRETQMLHEYDVSPDKYK